MSRGPERAPDSIAATELAKNGAVRDAARAGQEVRCWPAHR